MKNITLLFILISLSASAQYYEKEKAYFLLREQNPNFFYRYNNSEYYLDFAPKSKRIESQVKQVNIIYTDKKGKSNSLLLGFNKAGKHTYSKSKKIEFNAEFQNDTLETYSKAKYRGKISEYKKTYNDRGLKISEEKNHNNKRKFLLTNSYTTMGLLSETKVQMKKNTHQMTYIFNAENKLIKTTYLKNKKVKKTWNYDCKPQGEIEPKVKNEITSSKCDFKSENPDGSYSLFSRTIIKKTPYLTEEKFSKDSIKIAFHRFKNDSILTQSWIQDGMWERTIYYKKSKISYQYHIKYRKDRQVEEYQVFRRNKMIFLQKLSFDNQNNNLVTEYYNPKKNKTYRKLVNSYNEKGLKVSQKKYIKGKFADETKYVYSY